LTIEGKKCLNSATFISVFKVNLLNFILSEAKYEVITIEPVIDAATAQSAKGIFFYIS
jgi:hypothetical protein